MSTQCRTVKVPAEVVEALDRLAEATGRSRDESAAAALRDLLDYETWKEARIQRAIEEADRGEFAIGDEMEETFTRYRPDAAE